MSWKCWLGFHERVLERIDPEVQWIGELIGARPFQEAHYRCARCGFKFSRLERAPGQGWVP